jgi:hypothetical protein
MDPDSLEMFLFLKANKDLWENPAIKKAANNEVGSRG